MKKDVRFIFLMILSIMMLSVSSFANIKVEYRISKIHGLLDFLIAISGEPHHAPGLSEIYNRSSYSKEQKNIKQLNEFNTIKESLLFQNIGKNSKNLKGRFVQKRVDSFLITQSLFSKDLNDFSQRILGILSKKDHLIFINTLKQFKSIYENLIWKSSFKELSQHKIQLEKLARKAKLNQMFNKARIFYRAEWPEEIPFIVGLYPVPMLKDFKNSTNSHSMDSIEEHGVLIGTKNKDLEGSFGVIFHELCHSLYDSQSDSFMIEFENYFYTSPSKYKFQAYDWLNEALATAIGNGWAFQRVNKGQLDKGSWYNQPVIDGFGKAIFVKVSEYLEHDKPIDKLFVDDVISIYQEKFPNSIYEISSLMNKIAIIYNDSSFKGFELRSIIRGTFFVSSYSGNTPINNDESIQSMNENGVTTLFILSDNDIKDLMAISKQVPEINKNLKLIKSMKNKSILYFTDNSGKVFIFIKATVISEVKTAFDLLKKMKNIESDTKTIEF